MIYFGSSQKDTEAYIGAKGTLVDSYNISGNGWTDQYETYRYAMRWFDGEKPMDTDYVYRNGFLERIQIYPESSGYTRDQVRSLICEMSWTAGIFGPTVGKLERRDLQQVYHAVRHG